MFAIMLISLYKLSLIHIGDFSKRAIFLSLQWMLVYSIVLFRLAIFQVISKATKLSLAFKWVLYLFKRENISVLGSVTT